MDDYDIEAAIERAEERWIDSLSEAEPEDYEEEEE